MAIPAHSMLGVDLYKYFAASEENYENEDGILFKLETDRYWYVQADGQFETWLLANSNGFNVNISNPQVWVLQMQGPASTSVLKDASNKNKIKII